MAEMQTCRSNLQIILKYLAALPFIWKVEYCLPALQEVFYSLLKTCIYIITCMYTSILFYFFLLIYCVGPNVIETSVARTDLNNSLKVRVNKYCWIILLALFDVSNVTLPSYISLFPPSYFKYLKFTAEYLSGAFQFEAEHAILYYHRVTSWIAQQQFLVSYCCEQVK